MIIDKFKNLELYKHAISDDVSEEYEDWQYDLDTTNIVRLVAELEQLLIHSVVVSSLKKICTDLNIDTEEVLLEYDKKLNGFEVLYDEGIEQTFYVRKGFIQL